MAVTYGQDGLIVWIDIPHEDLQKADSLSALLPPGNGFGEAVKVALTVLRAVDAAGGNNGVSIVGIIGIAQFVTVPLPGRNAVTARLGEFGDAIHKVGIHWAGLLHRLVVRVGDIIDVWVEKLGRPYQVKQDNAWGRLEYVPHFDEWERVAIVHLNENEDHLVALLWHTGYSSDQSADVIKSQPEVQPWEKWVFHNNGDGTVSFSSLKSRNAGGADYFMSAQKDRITLQPHNGPWEKFKLVPTGDGRYGLRTSDDSHGAGKHLSSRRG